jgi:hypothetical protein
MPDLSYRQKHRSRQHITGRVAVACDRTTHGWLDQWLSNGDTYCKRAAWAWEIEQAAWPPTTISLRGVSLSLERGQLCHPLCFFEGGWGWSIGTVCWFLSGPGKRGTIRTDQNIGHCTVRLVITLRVYDLFRPIPAANNSRQPGALQKRNSLGRELIALQCSASTGQWSPGAAIRTTAMRAMRNDGQLH